MRVPFNLYSIRHSFLWIMNVIICRLALYYALPHKSSSKWFIRICLQLIKLLWIWRIKMYISYSFNNVPIFTRQTNMGQPISWPLLVVVEGSMFYMFLGTLGVYIQNKNISTWPAYIIQVSFGKWKRNLYQNVK